MDKDCFDNCTLRECAQCGHEVLPFKYCLVDPMIDRYEKRRTIKRPCNTCEHRCSRVGDYAHPCKRCTNYNK